MQKSHEEIKEATSIFICFFFLPYIGKDSAFEIQN